MDNQTPSSNKKLFLIGGILIFLVAVGGFVAYKTMRKSTPPPVTQETPTEEFGPIDPSISVNIQKSKTKDYTIVLTAKGLSGKADKLEYELSYETEGLIQGSSTGNKPVDLAGQDVFEREIYLGTCSRNVCKPHLGVKTISLVLQLTDSTGKKTQFSKDYDL